MNEAHDIANLLGDPRQPLDILEGMRDVDVPLTEEGKSQATQTGMHLAGQEHFDIVLSSPYVRCVETAALVIAQFNYSVRHFKDNRLRERESGWTYGMTTDAIKKRYPGEFKRRERDGKYWYRPPGGENWPDVEMRIHSFQDKLHRDYADQHVLVVTHAIPFLIFRALFEHLDEKQVLEIDHKSPVPNCGIETFDIDTSKHPEGRLKLGEYARAVYKTV
jgi:broad specificity phosphatase PhoE